jgi:hypothetical protein
MNARELERVLMAADPLGRGGREEVERLDFEAMEAELLLDVEREPGPALEPRSAPRPRRLSRLALAAGVAAVAAAIAVAIVFAGGGSSRLGRAYGAEVIRFAESTPLLLLEGPDWRVQNVTEEKTRGGTAGQMEFVTGKPVPYATLFSRGNAKEGQRVEGLQPASVRQRLVRLEWRDEGAETLAESIANLRGGLHPHGRHFVRLPVDGTSAFVDTRAEIFENQGGPGDREMVALWSDGGNVLRLVAAVPNLAAMEERLGWVTSVDSQAWLEAMPPKVIKAAEFDRTIQGMLRGVPVPKTFAPSRIPDEGLTTTRTQVANAVGSTVACLWFRQWGEAVRTGDAPAQAEAERAMATSRRWPLLNPAHGEVPGLASSIWQVAAEMPQGYWDFRGHHRDLLAHAEGMGCARLGLPLLPEKMKRQREQGVPPPPD